MNRLGYFRDSGENRKKYALITAVYYERVEIAKALVLSDPDQINVQDPHSGLTPLHIAIFRQNRELVQLLAPHRQCDPMIRDAFNRRAVDMLDYTSDQFIFETVMDAAYPDALRELQDEAYDEAKATGRIVPFKPKEP